MARLLRRDPAGRVFLGNPFGVAMLLDSLREAGAEQQATALAERLPGQACLAPDRAISARSRSPGFRG